ncbi:hypothetical protein N8920_07630 [Opitutales bacterium]|nr:hypothetical protein [Opitutales bacterium]
MFTKLKKEYLRFIRKQYFKNKNYYNKNVLLRDVFGKKRSRRVLLSTLTSSLTNEINFSHTNLLEHRIEAEIFDEFGYSVDVTNFNSTSSYFAANKYSVVYGGGASLIDSLHDKNCRSICYSTGVFSYTQKLNTYNSLKRFANTSNKYAYSSIRDVDVNLDYLYFTDCIVILGNSYTADTYVINSNIDRKKIYELNAFYFDIVKPSFCMSKINRSRNNFIWFGSSGFVHKGLDILIEFFRQNPSLQLYICGANPREKEFFSYYKKELSNKIDNIHNCGFVDLKGEIFKN